MDKDHRIALRACWLGSPPLRGKTTARPSRQSDPSDPFIRDGQPNGKWEYTSTNTLALSRHDPSGHPAIKSLATKGGVLIVETLQNLGATHCVDAQKLGVRWCTCSALESRRCTCAFPSSHRSWYQFRSCNLVPIPRPSPRESLQLASFAVSRNELGKKIADECLPYLATNGEPAPSAVAITRMRLASAPRYRNGRS